VIDEALFLKYLKLVLWQEGTTFIHADYDSRFAPDNLFTPEEWSTLDRLARQAEKEMG